MDFPKLIGGTFIRRDNRFRATVSVNGHEAWAHVPNSGRLKELFTPSRPVWLAPAASPDRKTAYDLKLVEFASTLVSVDARLPNDLFAEALTSGKLGDPIVQVDEGRHQQLQKYTYPIVEREITFDKSRLDLRLSGSKGNYWVETKSVTLVNDRVAMFPDAPTSRGRKHLLTLIKALEAGDKAAIVFIVQRSDAIRFQPHQKADPDFALALYQAKKAGVVVRAFTCWVSLAKIAIAHEIPVELAKPSPTTPS